MYIIFLKGRNSDLSLQEKEKGEGKRTDDLVLFSS